VLARAAPRLGEHNTEVLLSAGLNAASIHDLRASKVIPDEPE
jgi:crotonobetainyl-CoA:carnitine CoA-transferase CaiB-like acyl-CoA transferase